MAERLTKLDLASGSSPLVFLPIHCRAAQVGLQASRSDLNIPLINVVQLCKSSPTRHMKRKKTLIDPVFNASESAAQKRLM